ncbi:hypothetical protein FKM82_012497, partial [Ascaphus truei]
GSACGGWGKLRFPACTRMHRPGAGLHCAPVPAQPDVSREFHAAWMSGDWQRRSYNGSAELRGCLAQPGRGVCSGRRISGITLQAFHLQRFTWPQSYLTRIFPPPD